MFGSRGKNVAAVRPVQTPTLAIFFWAVELEIRNFKPRPYWRVPLPPKRFRWSAKGRTKAFTSARTSRKRLANEHDRIDRVWEQSIAEASLAACEGQPLATCHRGEEGLEAQARPRLYDLTTLQREANNRFGLSARRTLQIAQGALRAARQGGSLTHELIAGAAEDYVATCPRDAPRSLGRAISAKHGPA
jgi:DNA topoisomerase-3